MSTPLARFDRTHRVEGGACAACGVSKFDPDAHVEAPCLFEQRTGRLDRRDAPAEKLDAGKPRWDLLPFDALDEVAAVLAYGAEKYAPRNWETGLDWGRLLAAALRHLSAWARGQEIDQESGGRHLSHAACCVLMLLACTLRGVGKDDRK